MVRATFEKSVVCGIGEGHFSNRFGKNLRSNFEKEKIEECSLKMEDFFLNFFL